MVSSTHANINAKEYFSNYLFHSAAEELTTQEKCWITLSSIALGVLSLGLVHLACYIHFKNHRFSILDRSVGFAKTEDCTTFFVERLKKEPTNQKTKDFIKDFWQKRFEHAKLAPNEIKTLSKDLHYFEHLMSKRQLDFKKIVGEIFEKLNNLEAVQIEEEVKRKVDEEKNKIFLNMVNQNKETIRWQKWDFTIVSEVMEQLRKIYANDQQKLDKEIKVFIDELLQQHSNTDEKFAQALIGIVIYYADIKEIDTAIQFLGRFPKLDQLSQETQNYYKDLLNDKNLLEGMKKQEEAKK